ncbi:DUF4097 family beta strand repeat-containing protein [Crossiella sp. CA198]|uniref:DUF4097 family beta strand repeat-containing protein n=1 Tax=Crossiella sp. CA198 TaxID=3455607 RepID=UPI003F8D2197
MNGKTFTAAHPGVIGLNLNLDHGDIRVSVEDREHAEITLTPINPGDITAADLITRATVTGYGQDWTVTVPSPPEPAIHVRTTATRIPAGTTVIGAIIGGNGDITTGVTIVNGRMVSGHRVTGLDSGGGIRADVRLPEGSSVSVATFTARLTTVGELDRLAFRSTSGDLIAQDAGTVEARTISGDITAALACTALLTSTSGDLDVRCTADATLRTISGDISIGALTGAARVQSTSGRVDVHSVAASTVEANTVSGRIRLSADDGVPVQAHTRSVSGRITRNF